MKETIRVVLKRAWLLPNGRYLEARKEPYVFPKKWYESLPQSAFVLPPGEKYKPRVVKDEEEDADKKEDFSEDELNPMLDKTTK